MRPDPRYEWWLIPLIMTLVAFALVAAIVVPSTRHATAECEARAQRAGLRYWAVAERLQCLGSEDGQRWWVLHAPQDYGKEVR